MVNDDVEISETIVDHVRLVRITGELDADGADIAAHALGAPRNDATLATVVDLSPVTFADSAFLHMLLSAQQRHEEAGLLLVLAALTPPVRRLLDLTGTARRFAVVPDLPAAMDRVRAHDADRARP
ncbi:STAS domain-containing protein [Streptomyces sp. NPDC006458]|uniref:STAS domain-containing protein n=1 Tax=Streptomyces sp. NPDC006458 TaxID=3154302 RepID=UPI0033B6B5E1